jgi:hypothetical protein
MTRSRVVKALAVPMVSRVFELSGGMVLSLLAVVTNSCRTFGGMALSLLAKSSCHSRGACRWVLTAQTRPGFRNPLAAADQCAATCTCGNSACCCCCTLLQTYVGIVATLVCCYEALLKDHLLPDWGFEWPGLAVSTTGVYSLSTFALSLLLVFRTNSSYQRCARTCDVDMLDMLCPWPGGQRGWCLCMGCRCVVLAQGVGAASCSDKQQISI